MKGKLQEHRDARIKPGESTVTGIKITMEISKITGFLNCIVTVGINKCMSCTSIILDLSCDFR